MAAKNTEQAKAGTQEDTNAVKQQDTQGKTGAGTPKRQEAVYTVEEFAANAEAIFGTSYECVSAALKEKGITECTKQEAVAIVKAFCKREVK